MNVKKERNQSIELLRIILMILIIFGHVIGHGIGEGRYNQDGLPSFGALLQPLYTYHVDAFIFISGYYGIKLKWNKFITLISKWVLYSAVAVGVVMFLTDDYSITYLLNNIFPISTCDHWFMAEYLYLMLMAPLLNIGMESLTKRQSTLLVAILYISSFRLYYCLMIFIYLLGRHLRKYPISCFEKYSIWIFVGTLITYFLFNYICLTMEVYPKKMYGYMSPFVILAAVSLFYSFRKIHIKWDWIGYVAPGVLTAYLITDHEILRPKFTGAIVDVTNSNILLILLCSMVIVLVMALADYMMMAVIGKFYNIYSKQTYPIRMRDNKTFK